MRRAILAVVLSAGLSSGLTACVEKAPPKIEPVEVKAPVVADYEHHVGVGESLAQISNWYTGSPKNVAAIRAANPGLNPRRLKRGQTVIIPGPLVTRREPLPKNFGKAPAKSVAKRVPESVRREEATNSPVNDTPPATGNDADIVEKSLDVGAGSKPAEDAWKKAEVPSVPPREETAKEALVKEAKRPEDLDVGSAKPAENPPEKPGEAPVAEKKTEKAGGSDAEREKLLDELLSQ